MIKIETKAIHYEPIAPTRQHLLGEAVEMVLNWGLWLSFDGTCIVEVFQAQFPSNGTTAFWDGFTDLREVILQALAEFDGEE